MPLTLNNDLKNLKVGDYFWCKYIAPTSGQVGIFSDLATKTDAEVTGLEIPVASSATPNGYFRFIMVEDWNGKKRLVADRNIQNSISWDTLNSAGIASGNGVSTYIGDSIIPPMTSNNSNGIELTPSSERTAYSNYAYKAFDGSFSDGSTSVWCVNSGTSGDIRIKLSSARIVSSITMKSALVTTGTYAVKDWQFFGSNDGTTWDLLSSGTQQNNNQLQTYFFNNQNPYLYYKISILSSYGSIAGIAELKLFENNWKNSSFNMRLLTGGVNSSDTDNEWNRYIVNNTLNGTIIAGDNNVWNWSGLYSWTSTTSDSSSGNRVARGSSSVSNRTTIATSNTSGFRPILEIESLLAISSLINVNGEYKTWNQNNKQWVTVSTTMPTKQVFTEQGIEDITILNRKISALQRSMNDNGALGNGRVFKTTVDLQKYFDIRNLNVN